MTEPINMILQQLLDGQTSIEQRLGQIETTLAEKRGERRVGLWLVGTASGFVGAFVPTLLKLLHR